MSFFTSIAGFAGFSVPTTGLFKRLGQGDSMGMAVQQLLPPGADFAGLVKALNPRARGTLEGDTTALGDFWDSRGELEAALEEVVGFSISIEPVGSDRNWGLFEVHDLGDGRDSSEGSGARVALLLVHLGPTREDPLLEELAERFDRIPTAENQPNPQPVAFLLTPEEIPEAVEEVLSELVSTKVASVPDSERRDFVIGRVPADFGQPEAPIAQIAGRSGEKIPNRTLGFGTPVVPLGSGAEPHRTEPPLAAGSVGERLGIPTEILEILATYASAPSREAPEGEGLVSERGGLVKSFVQSTKVERTPRPVQSPSRKPIPATPRPANTILSSRVENSLVNEEPFPKQTRTKSVRTPVVKVSIVISESVKVEVPLRVLQEKPAAKIAALASKMLSAKPELLGTDKEAEGPSAPRTQPLEILQPRVTFGGLPTFPKTTVHRADSPKTTVELAVLPKTTDELPDSPKSTVKLAGKPKTTDELPDSPKSTVNVEKKDGGAEIKSLSVPNRPAPRAVVASRPFFAQPDIEVSEPESTLPKAFSKKGPSGTAPIVSRTSEIHDDLKTVTAQKPRATLAPILKAAATAPKTEGVRSAPVGGFEPVGERPEERRARPTSPIDHSTQTTTINRPTRADSPHPPTASASTVQNLEVVEQVSRAIRANRGPIGSEIRMRLVPENLGEIHIKISVNEGTLVAEIRASSEMTREVLLRESLKIQTLLRDTGVKVENVVVRTGGFGGEAFESNRASQREPNSPDERDPSGRGSGRDASDADSSQSDREHDPHAPWERWEKFA